MNVQPALISEVTVVPTTTALMLAALQGAAEDPDHIGAEYLPENITVNGVVVTDSAAAALPDGTIARNGYEPVVHDGSLTGGRVSRRAMWPGGVNSDLLWELFRIKLSAAECVAGKKIEIQGRTILQFAGTNVDLYFGYCLDANSGTVFNGALQQLHSATGVDFEIRDWATTVDLTNSSGLQATPVNGGSFVVGDGVALAQEDPISNTDNIGVVGIEQDLVFELHTQSTGAPGTSAFFFWDLVVSVY